MNYADVAELYRAAGWEGILPLPYKKKEQPPAGFTGRQGTWPDESQIQQWERRFRKGNAALRAPVDVIGIDIDLHKVASARDDLEERAGGKLPPTWSSSAREDGSGIFWFRVRTQADSEALAFRTEPVRGVEIIQTGHRYAVVWPSLHPDLDGARYVWRNPDGEVVEEIPAPGDLPLLPEGVEKALLLPEKGSGGDDPGSEPRSLGADVLGDTWPEGTRNNNLTRVAGHYAKHIPFKDLYEKSCRAAIALCAPGWDEEQAIHKTIESVWKTEHQKVAEVSEDFCLDNGWLVGDDRLIYTETKVGGKGKQEVRHEPWSDFNIQCLYVTDDGEHTNYAVRIRRHRLEDEIESILPAGHLADGKKLIAWLANHRVGLLHPDNDPHDRLYLRRMHLYLENQKPKRFKVTTHYGWDGDGFVTPAGVIRDDGEHPFEDVRPNPDLVQWAEYRYGMRASAGECGNILTELASFHYPNVTYPILAWWAAGLHKHLLLPRVAQWPFVALEAVSGSGKTKGFIPMVVELSGDAEGGENSTLASIRDRAKVSQTGITWADDLDEPSRLMELLRAIASGGSVRKKMEDNTTTDSTRLVSSFMLGGEALGVSKQRAMMDRAIQVRLRNPQGRPSLYHPDDPNRDQYDDIVEFRARYDNDLTCVAGSMQREGLRHVDLIGEFPSLKPMSGLGRFGDSMQILRYGARLLERMGLEGAAETVDAWVDKQESTAGRNTLTEVLIPWALQQEGMPRQAAPPEGKKPATPVWIDGNKIIHFRPDFLHHWVVWMRNGRYDERTESEASLKLQTEEVHVSPMTSGRLVGRGNVRWYNLSGDASKDVLSRAVTGAVTTAVTTTPESRADRQAEINRQIALDFMDLEDR